MSSEEPVFWTPILYDVAHAFESVEDSELRIDRVLTLMRRFVPYDRCALLEADPVLDRPISIVPEADGEDRAALTARLSTLLDLVSDQPPEHTQGMTIPAVPGRFHLAVPLIGLGETTGIVFVERDTVAYEERHLAFLSVIAAQIGAYLAAVRADRDLRSSEERFRRLYESGMIGIVFMDADGTITEANDTFAAIVRRPRDELEDGGANWHDMTPPEQRERERAAFSEAVERGRCRPYEKQFTRQSGRPITVLAGAACIETPNVLVAFVLDVSEQKRVETERAELLEERESDIGLLEMFVGMLGHDLRNPLGAIRMSAELLRHDGGEPVIDPEAISKTTDRILSSTYRMERLVDQVLDLTRIRLAGGMPIEPERADLRELCVGVIDELSVSHPDAAIDLEVDGDVVGEWDADRLLQVISNLLANAIQHSTGASDIVLRLTGAGEKVELVTRNSGAVPDDILPVLFDPFRGSEVRGPSKGLGLGLFITKHIVEAHGGNIEVDSSEERGTTFTVSLPRRPAANA